MKSRQITLQTQIPNVTNVHLRIILLCGLVTAWSSHSYAQRPQVLGVPGATIVTGYGPTNLWCEKSGHVVRVQPVASEPSSWAHHVNVTLSLDGQVIGSARLRGLGRERIATYSVKDHEWNEYAEVFNLWSVSVSADGDKIAYVAQERQDSPALFVLDRKSGKVQKLRARARYSDLHGP